MTYYYYIDINNKVRFVRHDTSLLLVPVYYQGPFKALKKAHEAAIKHLTGECQRLKLTKKVTCEVRL